MYKAKQEPGKARGRVLSHLIEHVFGGSPASLVLHLVETGNLTAEDLRHVRRRIASRSGSRKAEAAKSRKSK